MAAEKREMNIVLKFITEGVASVSKAMTGLNAAFSVFGGSVGAAGLMFSRFATVGAKLGIVLMPIVGAIYAIKKAFDLLWHSIDTVIDVLGYLATSLKEIMAQFIELNRTVMSASSILGEHTRVILNATREATALGFKMSESAKGIEEFARAGFASHEALEAFTPTAMFAKVAQASLGRATTLTVGALGAFNLQAKDTWRVVSGLTNAIVGSRMDFNALETSFGFAAAAGKSFGQTLEGTLSALMTFRNIGLQASTAGTVFRRVLAQFAKPGDAAIKAIEELGLTVEDFAVSASNNFSKVMNKIAATAVSNEDMVKKLLVIAGKRFGGYLGGIIVATRETWEKRRKMEQEYHELSLALMDFRSQNDKENELKTLMMMQEKRAEIERMIPMLERFQKNLTSAEAGDTLLNIFLFQTTQIAQQYDIMIAQLEQFKNYIAELLTPAVTQFMFLFNTMFRQALDHIGALEKNAGRAIDRLGDVFGKTTETVVSEIIGMGQDLFKAMSSKDPFDYRKEMDKFIKSTEKTFDKIKEYYLDLVNYFSSTNNKYTRLLYTMINIASGLGAALGVIIGFLSTLATGFVFAANVAAEFFFVWWAAFKDLGIMIGRLAKTVGDEFGNRLIPSLKVMSAEFRNWVEGMFSINPPDIDPAIKELKTKLENMPPPKFFGDDPLYNTKEALRGFGDELIEGSDLENVMIELTHGIFSATETMAKTAANGIESSVTPLMDSAILKVALAMKEIEDLISDKNPMFKKAFDAARKALLDMNSALKEEKEAAEEAAEAITDFGKAFDEFDTDSFEVSHLEDAWQKATEVIKLSKDDQVAFMQEVLNKAKELGLGIEDWISSPMDFGGSTEEWLEHLKKIMEEMQNYEKSASRAWDTITKKMDEDSKDQTKFIENVIDKLEDLNLELTDIMSPKEFGGTDEEWRQYVNNFIAAHTQAKKLREEFQQMKRTREESGLLSVNDVQQLRGEAEGRSMLQGPGQPDSEVLDFRKLLSEEHGLNLDEILQGLQDGNIMDVFPDYEEFLEKTPFGDENQEKLRLVYEQMAEMNMTWADQFNAQLLAITETFQSSAEMWGGVTKNAFQGIQRGLTDTVKAFLTNSGKISDIWKALGKSMLGSIIDVFTKMLMQQLFTAIAGVQIRKAESRVRKTAASTEAQLNAYAWGSLIGGPTTGKIAAMRAARDTAAIMAAGEIGDALSGSKISKAAMGSPLGGFGGGVPGVDSVPVLQMPDEITLDSNASDVFRSMVFGGGGGGGDVHLHVNALDGQSVVDVWDAQLKPLMIDAMQNDGTTRRTVTETVEGRV